VDRIILTGVKKIEARLYPLQLTSINQRIQSHNCPYCLNKKASKENNLKFLFPKIAEEWHPTKNGNLKPENFVKGSGKKVWWKCI
jgi:hypothetical protein